MLGSSLSHGDKAAHWWKSSRRANTAAPGAAMVAERSTWKWSGRVPMKPTSRAMTRTMIRITLRMRLPGARDGDTSRDGSGPGRMTRHPGGASRSALPSPCFPVHGNHTGWAPPGPGASQQLLKPRVAGAAHRQLLAVLEDRDAAVAGVELEARQAFDVEHPRAMDAHEARRVEPGGNLRERLGLEQGAARGVDRDAVVLALEPPEPPDRDDGHLGPLHDPQPLDERSGRARRRPHPRR